MVGDAGRLALVALLLPACSRCAPSRNDGPGTSEDARHDVSDARAADGPAADTPPQDTRRHDAQDARRDEPDAAVGDTRYARSPTPADARGPAIPDAAADREEIAAGLAPCERYLQPVIDRPRERSGLDANWFAGFDDDRVVFASARGLHLWEYDVRDARWRWLSDYWVRLGYAGGWLAALQSLPDDSFPLEAPHIHLWQLDEGWDRRIPAKVTYWADDISVGQGFVAYADIRPSPRPGWNASFPMLFDLATEESHQLSDRDQAGDLSAGGPYVVWVDVSEYPEDESELFLYDHRSGETRRLTDDDAWQFEPRTDGRTVVWTDSRDGEYVPQGTRSNLNVYRLDTSSGEVARVTSEEHSQMLPDVDGDLVVYQDCRAGTYTLPGAPNRPLQDYDVFLANWRTGREFRLTAAPREQFEPRVHGRTVLYKDARFGTGTGYPGLTLLDLDCFEEAHGVDVDAHAP